MELIDNGIRLPLTWLNKKFHKIMSESMISAGILTDKDL